MGWHAMRVATQSCFLLYSRLTKKQHVFQNRAVKVDKESLIYCDSGMQGKASRSEPRDLSER